MGSSLSIDDASSQSVINIRGRLYRLLEVVGQGSEATVYRCEDQNAMQYAAKVFYYSRFPPATVPKRIQEFHKEGQTLKYLGSRSRHFIYLVDYEYKPDENVGYMIMELADRSLRDQLAGAPLNDGLRKTYWKQITTILKDLQDARVVHADIKPDNMLLVNNVLKLSDLGLAFRMASPNQTVQRSRVRGTLDYMAPEIFARQTGFKSDVWSAGAILYEMTYGRPPYFRIMDRNQKVAAISSRSPIPFPSIKDRTLFDCIKRCLQFDIRRRPDAYQLKIHPYSKT